ncbi:MAG TPA: beta-N-acetylhexosaminidase [Candidatus Dormibacteraeota bacterium]
MTALGVLLPGFDGLEAPAWLRRAVAEGLGGVVLFARNVRSPEQVAALVAALRAEREDVLVAIDEEGGDVTRLDAATGSSTPGNLALGAAGDVRLTQQVAAEIGARLAELGIDLDLAPVADVNADPLNPIVGVRSFGSDPALVAEHTAAFVRGLQSQGVAACAKHFPGHGATRADSHVEMPVLARVDLAPFEAAIATGVKAVMPAHAVAPEYDSRPATLSRRLLSGVLRGELGFGGLVVSDGMDMHALAEREGAAGEALVAGVDALCLGGTPRTEADLEDYQAALAAVPEVRLAEAAGRVREVARWAAQARAARPAAGAGAGAEAARRALRSEGEVRVGARAAVVRLDPPASWAAGPVPWGLGGEVPLETVDGRPLVLVVRDLHRHPWQQEVVEAHPEAVVVEMGTPVLKPRARGYVATYGAARPNAEAAREVLGL